MRTVQKPAETTMIMARQPISAESAPDKERLFSEQLDDSSVLGRSVLGRSALGHRLDELRIGAPDDRYEQEADRVAEQVAGRLENGASPSASAQVTPTPGPAVQAKGEGGASSGSAAALTQLPPAPGSGRPLEPAVRTSMERAFGANLGDVRLHSNDRAQQLNQSLDARATTVGRDVYFDQGQYDPGSTSGRELLAHELTHVLQQRHGGHRLQPARRGDKGKEEAPGAKRPPQTPADPGDSPERQRRMEAGPPEISPPAPEVEEALQRRGAAAAPIYEAFQAGTPMVDGPAAGQGAVPASAPANEYGQLHLAPPAPEYSNFGSAAAQAVGQGTAPASTPANEYGQLHLAPPAPEYSNFGSAAARAVGQGAAPASVPGNEYGQLNLAPAENDYQTASEMLGRDDAAESSASVEDEYDVPPVRPRAEATRQYDSPPRKPAEADGHTYSAPPQQPNNAGPTLSQQLNYAGPNTMRRWRAEGARRIKRDERRNK